MAIVIELDVIWNDVALVPVAVGISFVVVQKPLFDGSPFIDRGVGDGVA
jgi:hypothetical protein